MDNSFKNFKDYVNSVAKKERGKDLNDNIIAHAYVACEHEFIFMVRERVEKITSGDTSKFDPFPTLEEIFFNPDFQKKFNLDLQANMRFLDMAKALLKRQDSGLLKVELVPGEH